MFSRSWSAAKFSAEVTGLTILAVVWAPLGLVLFMLRMTEAVRRAAA